MTRDEMIEVMAESICVSDCQTIEDLSSDDFEPRWASLRDIYLANSRSALSALEAEEHVVVPVALLIEARAGMSAYTGGDDGACRETIARIDAVLSAAQQEKTDG